MFKFSWQSSVPALMELNFSSLAWILCFLYESREGDSGLGASSRGVRVEPGWGRLPRDLFLLRGGISSSWGWEWFMVVLKIFFRILYYIIYPALMVTLLRNHYDHP